MTHRQTTENSAPATRTGLNYTRTLLVSVLLTVFVMTLDVLPDKAIDYVARAGLVLIALLGALTVTRGNFLSAVWAPILSWFIALITVGQLTRPTAGSNKERELILILHGLADHAWWILGATALAAVVVFIRRSR